MKKWKKKFFEKIIEKIDNLGIIKIKENFEYEFYNSHFNINLNYLLVKDKKRIGIHIVSQFSSGTAAEKSIYFFLEKLQTIYFPVILIYVEDLENDTRRMPQNTLWKIIQDKNCNYINFDRVTGEIIKGEKLLLDKIKYYLEI